MYSRAAVKLGVALPLLGWCYDAVQRDGWVTLNLKDAAADMDVPYQTMKRWWSELRGGPFFAEVEDHGRNGYRMQFADAWIDWRILRARPETKPSPVKIDEVPEVIPETEQKPSSSTQVHVKYTSSTNEGPEVIPEEIGIKEDIYTANKKTRRAVRAASPDDVSSSDHQRLMACYQTWLGYPIPNGGKEGAAARKLLKSGYTAEQVEDAYYTLKGQAFYSDKHLSLAIVHEQIGALTTQMEQRRRQRDRSRTNGHHTPPVTLAPEDTASGADIAALYRSTRV